MEVLLCTRKKPNHWDRQISGTCSRRPRRVSIHQASWFS